jgi:hypothetical protein
LGEILWRFKGACRFHEDAARDAKGLMEHAKSCAAMGIDDTETAALAAERLQRVLPKSSGWTKSTRTF